MIEHYRRQRLSPPRVPWTYRVLFALRSAWIFLVKWGTTALMGALGALGALLLFATARFLWHHPPAFFVGAWFVLFGVVLHLWLGMLGLVVVGRWFR